LGRASYEFFSTYSRFRNTLDVVSDWIRFPDRRAAGRALAQELRAYSGRDDVVVLALPRGGVPVAYEVAKALHAPLDVFTVRKLGVPGHEEYAMGALASDGSYFVDRQIVDSLHISPAQFAAVVRTELAELQRREAAYRDRRSRIDLRGKTVIVVDDGLATGASMQAAVGALRDSDPARVIVAVPVGAEQACAQLRRSANEVICLATPHPFVAVGQHYEDFSQTEDEEVRRLLKAEETERQEWQAA
jgi:predicted phosphoribosyltransferase